MPSSDLPEAHSPGGVPPSLSSAETINDGQFHTVELVTFDQMVNLSIDGGSPMTMDNFGKHYTLNSEAPLYVGGEDLSDRKSLSPSHGYGVPKQEPPVFSGLRLARRACAMAGRCQRMRWSY